MINQAINYLILVVAAFLVGYIIGYFAAMLLREIILHVIRREKSK
jgi:uncharacterized protein YneF (UPF0154 family)